MTTQNQTDTLTQRVILSAAFDPTGRIGTDAPTPASSFTPGPIIISKSNHWQDTISDGIMNQTQADPTSYGELSGELTVANEFELDAESITHTWQTMTAPLPLPGVAHVRTGVLNSSQMVALVIDLGLMREIISVQGILVDRTIHPNSTSGHHIRRQHLLDISRSQWANVHNLNRATGFVWNDPNRLPGLTIGPMLGRVRGGSDRDDGYFGQEPSNDPRGLEQVGSTASGQSPTNITAWDWTFDYKGRRRYRGLIRRLTLTQLAGQPDIWRFQFDFEVVKNELQLRILSES